MSDTNGYHRDVIDPIKASRIENQDDRLDEDGFETVQLRSKKPETNRSSDTLPSNDENDTFDRGWSWAVLFGVFIIMVNIFN